MATPETGRFAPSPTGRLHLGHACSALLAHDDARQVGGRFLLRIEDIDRGRSRPEFVHGIRQDLAWLGLTWDPPVVHQSQRFDAYREALARLGGMNLLYRCYCTRREILAATRAPQEGAAPSPPYPGFCRPRRDLRPPPAAEAARPFALRLDMRRAIGVLGGARAVRQCGWCETGEGEAGWRTLDPEALVGQVGDVVLARKDIPGSYHLAVVVDDAAAGVTRIVRGQDLLASTPIHRLLQALLRLPTPRYHHHPLVRDEHGRRLAKRDGDTTLAALRAAGETAAGIRARLGLPAPETGVRPGPAPGRASRAENEPPPG